MCDSLTRHALVLLWQPPDERVGGRPADGALERSEAARQYRQQRRFARAVGANDPDDVARRDCQIEMIEQHTMGVASGDVLGDEVRSLLYRRTHIVAACSPSPAVECRGIVS